MEYKTTMGLVYWDEKAIEVEKADDPSPPEEGEGWRLVGSTISDRRFSRQTIFWFWERTVQYETYLPK